MDASSSQHNPDSWTELRHWNETLIDLPAEATHQERVHTRLWAGSGAIAAGALILLLIISTVTLYNVRTVQVNHGDTINRIEQLVTETQVITRIMAAETRLLSSTNRQNTVAIAQAAVAEQDIERSLSTICHGLGMSC